MKKIETVCVIGSGVMGSGIAAQVANSGTKVILLDINDEIVKNSYEKLFTTKPLPLSHPSYAENIKLGNLQDNLALIKEADLIIEVIVEKLEVKHKLYQTITKYLKTSAILASNTSTLPLHKLKEKLEHSLRSRFIITHFFNPPRYMELLELVTSDETDRSIIQDIKYFLKTKMGKTVVECNDTPGFIANRIGCFLLELIVRKAIKANLNPYLVDYVFTKDYGFPSTGIFGLYDLIGHDVMNLISESLLHSLPEEDAYHKIYVTCKLLSKMKEQNLIGRKAGAGFYKMIKDENGKNVKQVIDFENLNYKNIETNDDSAERTYISQVMEEFFLYVKSLVPSVTQNKDDIEAAMKLGYSLKYGPFELMDRVENKFQKSNDKNINKIILENDSAFLSLENNNYIFKMKTKMNILDHNVFNLISEAISYLEEKNATMYIFPNGNVFSAGADLIYFQNLIEAKNAKKIDDFLLAGQQAMLRIKYAIIPIIACARGMALGGGAEILLHASHVVLHQNLNAGLVELGLDLIPAFGGTKEMFMRSSGSKKILVQNLRNILEQNKSSSADYFSRDYNVKSTICMHKDLLLKQTNVYSKHIDYCHKVQLPSMSLKSEIDISNYNDLQINILEFFQKIIDKQNITEQEFLNLEREKVLELAFNFDALKKIKAITNR